MSELPIDLRSDTVTRPTPAMRRAMAEAEVGDDVYGEDPTVNRLELRAAEILGKQAAVFLPSGTMGNTIGLTLHTTHGQEVICESRSHIINYELSMLAWFAGCLARSIQAPNGILSWNLIRDSYRPLGPHWAPTGAVEIENTHNMAGGTVYPVAVIDEICDEAHTLGLKVHMDGARIFNAAAYLGEPACRIAQKCDSVTFCLSKALGAPVGSMLCGTVEDIARARLYRKRLGGGMRQAGVLAAAGLIALEEHPALLPADHANARMLAEGLARIPGIQVDLDTVQTNIVMWDVTGTGMTTAGLSAALKTRGVLINPNNARRMRLVTHHDVNRAACERALEIVAATVRDNRRSTAIGQSAN